MKKFFLCIIILLAFGLFVFFTGWTQIKLDKSKTDTNYGIIVSKLGGINPVPVEKGKIFFSKAFLIPSNAELIQFSNKPFFAEKKIEGSLYSFEGSEDLSDSENKVDFNYSFTFSMELHVNPEDTINLMKKNIIRNQEDLTSYLDVVSQEICQTCTSFYLKKSIEADKTGEIFFPESYSIIDIFRSTRLYEKYPDITIDAIALKTSQIPDYRLFEKIRENRLKEITGGY